MKRLIEEGRGRDRSSKVSEHWIGVCLGKSSWEVAFSNFGGRRRWG